MKASWWIDRGYNWYPFPADIQALSKATNMGVDTRNRSEARPLWFIYIDKKCSFMWYSEKNFLYWLKTKLMVDSHCQEIRLITNIIHCQFSNPWLVRTNLRRFPNPINAHVLHEMFKKHCVCWQSWVGHQRIKDKHRSVNFLLSSVISSFVLSRKPYWPL